MTCQICGARRATIFKFSAAHGKSIPICTQCMNKQSPPLFKVTSVQTVGGVTSIKQTITNFQPSLVNFYEPQRTVNNLVCPNCGHDLRKLGTTNKLGCSECYTVFREQLAPIIRRIHGVGGMA